MKMMSKREVRNSYVRVFIMYTNRDYAKDINSRITENVIVQQNVCLFSRKRKIQNGAFS